MDKIISMMCTRGSTVLRNNGIAKTLLSKPSCFKIWSTPCSSNLPTSNRMKVTVLGAGGNLGKSVSLLLKQCPYIDELCLYDYKSMGGFATDLNYIDTKCTVTAFTGIKDITPALCNAKVVVILASTSNPHMLNYENLFEKNAALVKDLAVHVANHAPKALITIATEPINSIIPMFSEIMKKHGRYSPNSLFGITTIDAVRTNKFVAEVMGLDPECVVVPMIGGHTEKTIIPVLSRATPCNNFTNEELEDITSSVRAANENLSKLRSCEGVYLSNAFAISRFVLSLVKAQGGGGEIVECAYVRSSIHPQLKYMVTPLSLGPGGVMKNLGMPDLSDYEYCLLENAIPLLIEDIKRGECAGSREKCGDKPICDPCDPNPKAPRCPPDHCELQSLIAGNRR